MKDSRLLRELEVTTYDGRIRRMVEIDRPVGAGVQYDPECEPIEFIFAEAAQFP